MTLPKPIQNLPGAAFLNKYWLDKELRAAMNPMLLFNGVLPITDSDSKQFIYNKIENTATKDLEDGVLSLQSYLHWSQCFLSQFLASPA